MRFPSSEIRENLQTGSMRTLPGRFHQLGRVLRNIAESQGQGSADRDLVYHAPGMLNIGAGQIVCIGPSELDTGQGLAERPCQASRFDNPIDKSAG